MIAEVIVKATEPAAKMRQEFDLAARVRRRRASLSVSSATKMAKATVRKAVVRSVIRIDFQAIAVQRRERSERRVHRCLR
jgi:hypothetical protein